MPSRKSRKLSRVQIIGERKEFKLKLSFSDASVYYFLSKNEACKCQFLKNIIDECDDSIEKLIFNVPSFLYRYIRKVDLTRFYELLVGEIELCTGLVKYEKICNYKDVWRLCNVFMVDEELPFVQVLNNYYNPEGNPEIV